MTSRGRDVLDAIVRWRQWATAEIGRPMFRVVKATSVVEPRHAEIGESLLLPACFGFDAMLLSNCIERFIEGALQLA